MLSLSKKNGVSLLRLGRPSSLLGDKQHYLLLSSPHILIATLVAKRVIIIVIHISFYLSLFKTY